jgi:hypothetical protein
MPRRRINLSVSHDEFEDLKNALEDHRDGFKKMADEAINGFGLEPAYWAKRAQEVEGLRLLMHEHSREEPEDREVPSRATERGTDPASDRNQDFEPGSRH